MSKEAMKLALEALEDTLSDDPYPYSLESKAITALREALEKPDFWEGYVPEPVKSGEGASATVTITLPAQQEPVAWMNPNGGMLTANYINNFASGLDKEIHNIPLYTSPPAQQEPVLQDIEQYRLQMAGICTAAIGYWKEGDGIHPDYDTIALRDVAKLYAKYDELYRALARDREQPAQQEPVAWQPLPCPFCGHIGLDFADGETYRWGVASCGGCGASCGDVRREYPDKGEWHTEAIAEWNKRSPAAQRTWVGLTDEEIRPLCNQVWVFDTVKQWVQIIEAKLKEKNNG